MTQTETELYQMRLQILQLEKEIRKLKRKVLGLLAAPQPTRYKFFVNGKEFGTDSPILTGQQIRESLAAWESRQSFNPEDWPESEAQASWILWLDHTGNTPAEQLTGESRLRLDDPEPPRFFTMPPTTNQGAHNAKEDQTQNHSR